MRKLEDIMEDILLGKEPTYEELYYSLLVYRFMFNMDHNNLKKELIGDKVSNEIIKKMKAQNSHDMLKGALSKSPKEYLGWKNDPKNPEYKERRVIANKVLDKVIERHNLKD